LTDSPDAALVSEPSPSLRSLIRADFDQLAVVFSSAVEHLFPSGYVALSYRIAHALHQRGRRKLAGIVMIVCQVLTGAEIRPDAKIGPGLVVVHPSGVVVGGSVVAGRNLSLWGSNTLGYAWRGESGGKPGSPTLGDDVALFTHASVVGGVTVGDRVLIAAYSLVLDDMPDDTWPRGIPAKPAPPTL
jgi:serine O-acetyltransferase